MATTDSKGVIAVNQNGIKLQYLKVQMATHRPLMKYKRAYVKCISLLSYVWKSGFIMLLLFKTFKSNNLLMSIYGALLPNIIKLYLVKRICVSPDIRLTI